MVEATSLRREKRLEDALACIEKAEGIEPNFVYLLTDKGLVLSQLGRFEEAVRCFDRLLECLPSAPEARMRREEILKDALALYDGMLDTDPANVAVLFKHGNILQHMHRHEDAVRSYRRALETDARNQHVWNNLGNSLLELDRPEEAIAAYDRALEIFPDNEIALFNRGNILQQLGLMDEAIQNYRRALSCRPDFPKAVMEQGICRLAMGDYEEGWRLFEARWRIPQMKGWEIASPEPLWLGEEDITGKTVLLWAEQGLGDTLQFLRYVPLVARKAGHVILRVPPALRTLSETLECSLSIVTPQDELPPHDFHCTLMSLPLAFGTRLESIPADIPYLHADTEGVGNWRSRLGTKRRPRVGLVWAGRRREPINRTRDMYLEFLRPLTDLDLEIISLQKEVPDEDRAALESMPQINPLGETLKDFADTAALIENLDLVITVDTAVAHLTGALGKPVWIMLRHSGEWRWLLNRCDSPWYPSARIFRQKVRGDWAGVVREVAVALSTLFFPG
jgi:Flp pilus assembly protein TadD